MRLRKIKNLTWRVYICNNCYNCEVSLAKEVRCLECRRYNYAKRMNVLQYVS